MVRNEVRQRPWPEPLRYVFPTVPETVGGTRYCLISSPRWLYHREGMQAQAMAIISTKWRMLDEDKRSWGCFWGIAGLIPRKREGLCRPRGAIRGGECHAPYVTRNARASR